jgi:raffinose/stachyose/melibiose transport system permease protein
MAVATLPAGARAASPAPRRRRPNAHVVVVQIVLVGYALISIGPLILVLLGSMRSTGDIIRSPLSLPSRVDTSNYVHAWRDADFSSYMVNSLLVTTGAVLLCLATSVLASYVIARWSFPGRALLAALFLSGLMLPVKLGIVPIYHMLLSAHLIDSRLGLVLVYAASSIPLAVFILAAFFRGLPHDLEDAARIDGAGEFRLFWSVMLPLVRPAMATVAALTFVLNWNDFFFPLVLLRSQQKFTITVGLLNFFGQYQTNIGALFAGLLIAIIPLLIIFVVATKQIVAGLTAGMGK